jgi:hypothetical protein
MLRAKPQRPKKTLLERSQQIRAEIDRYIDERAEQLRQETENNIPLPTLRNMLMARSGGCQCRAIAHILEQS